MSTLICGSVAYDTIMVYPGEFKDQILPDKVHILNVSFLVPEMRREFGGTAGNIAYNLKMLGGDPIIMATIGEDCDPYLEHLQRLDITARCVRRIESTFTGQAFVTTDQADNQITAFHPGAMSHSHENAVGDAGAAVKRGIVSPDGRDGMLAHSRQFKAAGIPFMFDPGQAMPLFNGDELLALVDMADQVAVNDYEAELLIGKTGLTIEQLAERAGVLVVTLGPKGSRIYADGERHEIPCAKPTAIVDPTGGGDAYRAGLLYGMSNGMDWPTTGRLSALLGAIKIAHRGAQNHRIDLTELRSQFETEFGVPLTLTA
ncbi:carbohydrate kinase family protein [soil metagenome]